MLRADIKPDIDGEAAHRAASPSISVLIYLRIAIAIKLPNLVPLQQHVYFLVELQSFELFPFSFSYGNKGFCEIGS